MQLLPQPNYDEYLLESQDYWARLRGSIEPPAPSYRTVNGRQVLGRYVDPYGAAGLMASARYRWSHWYTFFLIGAGGGVLFGGVDAVFLFLALPILTVWYLAQRARHRAMYDSYWRIAQEIERTGEPVWVAYDKDRLALIERRPQAVWP